MRIPDPKANTTTEAYLAYKAGYLEESELKPVLYEPYLHFDAWLAYWAGLTNEYPFNASEKNVLQLKKYSASGIDVKLAAGGMISVSGTTQATYANFLTYQTPIDLKAGAYTFSRVGDKTYKVSLTVYNEDKSQYTSISIAAGSSSSTANIAFDIKYIAGAFTGLTVGSSLDFVTGLQLEAGSDASEFVPSTIPEMLCDEEALVAYLSGVTDTYPEEIKDPYDVRIVGYLRYLVSARFGRPDYPVNNEEFYLSTMKPTHTSNPEPSADIELDTAEGKVISVEAYGDTFQQTYSGKNLIDSTNTTYVYSNSPSQVTLTAIEGGIRMMNSGSGTQGRFAVFKSIDLTSYTGKVVRMKANFGTNGRIRLYRIASDGSNRLQQASTTVSGNGISFTVPEDLGGSPYLGYVLEVIGGNNTTVDFTDLIMTVDAELEPFEPYVGGIPAPNPDYPQPIQTVTGEQTITVRGKNFFNSNEAGGRVSNATKTVNGDTVKVEATSGSNAYGTILIPNSDALLGKTCTLSFGDVSTNYSSSYSPRVAVHETKTTAGYYANTTIIGVQVVSTGYNVTFTFPDSYTSDNNGFVIVLYTSNAGSSTQPGWNAEFSDIQLEVGEEATTYEPYVAPQSFTVDLGSTELCKLGDYQDKIFKNDPNEDWYDPDLEDNAWYVHKTIDKITFTGAETENWSHKPDGSERIAIPNAARGSSTNNPVISNYYVARFSTSYDGSIFLSGQSSEVGIVDFTNGVDTTTWKTWLETHNVIIYYAMYEPSETKITDTTLVGQLDALAGADTYNRKTYIKVTATDPNLPARLKVEAYKY